MTFDIKVCGDGGVVEIALLCEWDHRLSRGSMVGCDNEISLVGGGNRSSLPSTLTLNVHNHQQICAIGKVRHDAIKILNLYAFKCKFKN